MEETLGKRIVANRKRLGLTQDQLAEKLGVTAQAVSKWENDQSCPDITTLPKLAAIFGVTTDCLLGIEPQPSEEVRDAEIVRDEPAQERCGNKWEFKYDAGRKGSVGFALWVLLVGVLLLANSLLHRNVGFWEILWPSGLLVFGLFGLYPKFSFFRLGSALLGGYYLLVNLQVPVFALGKELLLPIFLLLFGLSLLVDALRKNKQPSFQVFRHGNPVHSGEKKHSTRLSQEDTRFQCDTSFGEDRHIIDLPHLTHGEASVSFGELTVDLSGCESFAENCHIDLDCSFGELILCVPSTCRVEPDTDTSFGCVNISGEPAPDAASVIHIDCDASFGSITIRYI